MVDERRGLARGQRRRLFHRLAGGASLLRRRDQPCSYALGRRHARHHQFGIDGDWQ